METIQRNSVRAWLLAARPKTLAAALVPVVTATALALADGVEALPAALLCVCFAALMQVASNFINDLYDFLRGTDRDDRLGPERACAQGWISPRAMRVGIGLTVSLACVVGLCLLALVVAQFRASGLSALPVGTCVGLVAVGLMCVVFAFLYTTRLSYCALGDVLVWVFFGFVPVCGTYYVQAHTLTPAAWLLGAGCGLVVDTLLVLNNYRDRDADRLSGKLTVVVLLGERFGSRLYLAQGILAYLCMAATALWGYGCMALLPALYLPVHWRTWRTMVSINSGRGLNRILGLTSRNMLLLALLVVLALLCPWGRC